MKFLEYIKRVKKMGLPMGKYAILGSGPIVIRGLRDSKDIDLIVTEDIFEEYKKKPGWKLREVYNNEYLEKEGIELWAKICPGEWDLEEMINKAEMINGLPFVNLKDFIGWKKSARREKDAKDVQLTEEYIQKTNLTTKTFK